MTESFRHKSRIEVRFVDIDAFGHVNNAHYLTYAEQARVSYFSEVIRSGINWKSEGLILAGARIDYVKPVLLSDEVYAYTRCSRIGTKSFELEYVFVNEKGGSRELMAKLSTVLVAFNYESGSSIPVPDVWKQELRAYEHTPPGN
jgi:acyl-CoA thioester hydrolase